MTDNTAKTTGPVSTSPSLWLLVSLVLIAIVALFGPEEQSLGTGVRIVYLHGVWVWAALLGLAGAAAVGVLAFAVRRISWHRWSAALARTGLFFWISYIPLSMWAAQVNWNGLFLAEPRWRVAFTFALGGLVIQLGLSLVDNLHLSSLLNFFFFGALLYALSQAQDVMHPASPIFTSGSLRIQGFFIGLMLLTTVAAWQLTRWWYRYQR